VNGVPSFFLENPILLVPVLLILAMWIYAIAKRLLKLSAILLIAVALYFILVEYVNATG